MEYDFLPNEETRLLHRLEQLLYRHPSVAEVAALPSPRPGGEMEWLVLIVAKAGSGSGANPEPLQKELEALCRTSLPETGFARVRIVKTLPRTPSGKLPRGWLYEQYGMGDQHE